MSSTAIPRRDSSPSAHCLMAKGSCLWFWPFAPRLLLFHVLSKIPSLRAWREAYQPVAQLHPIPIPIVTNYHKLSGTKHQLSHSSGHQKSKMGSPRLESRGQQVCIPSRGSRGRIRPPCLVQLLRATRRPWLVTPSSSELATALSLGPLLPGSHLSFAHSCLPFLRA